MTKLVQIMSKSLLDKIQNPDVPGLEQTIPINIIPPPPPPPPLSFPPPPPPPPFPKNESNHESKTPVLPNLPVPVQILEWSKNYESLNIESTQCTQNLETGVNFSNAYNSDANLTNASLGTNFLPFSQINPYYVSTPPQPSTLNNGWWPTPPQDSTNFYNQWYNAGYQTQIAPTSIPLIDKDSNYRPKVKFIKRKYENIDPQVDAEKVANAQKELAALMMPLHCNLCNAKMNSALQAKLHYEGKPHQKKVSMFLNQSVKKVKTEEGLVASMCKDRNASCDICKTWFTSELDASQHYAGKKHLRNVLGTAKLGQSNQSIPQMPVEFNTPLPNIIFPDNPNPIAPVITSYLEKFPPPNSSSAFTGELSNMTTNIVDAQVSELIIAEPNGIDNASDLNCKLCGVITNRPDQLELHKKGSRHQKMIKLNNLNIVEPETPPTPIAPVDYSIYRTPSGQYYCALCNISLNSEHSFHQHIEGKNHQNQANPKVPNTSTARKLKSKKKKLT